MFNHENVQLCGAVLHLTVLNEISALPYVEISEELILMYSFNQCSAFAN